MPDQRHPSFPEDFPSITGHPVAAFETTLRTMIESTAAWAADNPEPARELAKGPVPAEFPLSLLKAIVDALPDPGAPAPLHYLTRAHAPAVCHHPWSEYIAQLRLALDHAKAQTNSGFSGTVHVCRCITEAIREP